MEKKFSILIFQFEELLVCIDEKLYFGDFTTKNANNVLFYFIGCSTEPVKYN